MTIKKVLSVVATLSLVGCGYTQEAKVAIQKCGSIEKVTKLSDDMTVFSCSNGRIYRLD